MNFLITLVTLLLIHFLLIALKNQCSNDNYKEQKRREREVSKVATESQFFFESIDILILIRLHTVLYFCLLSRLNNHQVKKEIPTFLDIFHHWLQWLPIAYFNQFSFYQKIQQTYTHLVYYTLNWCFSHTELPCGVEYIAVSSCTFVLCKTWHAWHDGRTYTYIHSYYTAAVHYYV